MSFKYTEKFAVFILSHGRADTITTYDFLRKYNYTGKIYVVIDNEDDQEILYKQKFKEDVIQFDKRDYIAKTDVGDLDKSRKIGVFARNFIQDKAKEMGYSYHLQLDDDIFYMYYRVVKNGKLKCIICNRLDDVLAYMVELLENTNITALSFGHPAYYVGGDVKRFYEKSVIPKAMTTFMMRANDIRYFYMRMNDDITTSALNGMRGSMYFTYLPLMVNLEMTQKAKGGMTEEYQNLGTYRKSFYTVMAMPSCTKIYYIGITENRLHHEIKWRNCVPKLLSERWRK